MITIQWQNMGPDRRICHFHFLFKIRFDTYTPLGKDTAWHTRKKNICPTRSKGIFPFVHELWCCLLLYQLRKGIGKEIEHTQPSLLNIPVRMLYGHLGEEEIKRLLPQTDITGLEAAACSRAEPGQRTCLGELGAIRPWLPARPSPAAAETSPQRQGDRRTHSAPHPTYCNCCHRRGS